MPKHEKILLSGTLSANGGRKTNMHPEVRDLWADALESGEYKQGHGALRDNEDRFCCLGVLCDLAVKAGVIPEPSQYHSGYTYGIDSALLPREVQQWAGWFGQTRLINMNDGLRNRFKTIAKYVRENL